MKTTDFEFNTDATFIPSDPLELRGKVRDSGRMIVLDRSTDAIVHSVFSTIHDYFRPGDLLVLNDSYIMANSLWFKRGDERVHVSLYGHEPDGTYIVLMQPEQQSEAVGLTLTSINDDRLTCTLLEPMPNQLWKAKFEPLEQLVPTLDQFGHMFDDTIEFDQAHWRTKPEAYRSVYAKKPGSLDIPSAGLHFSTDLLTQIASKGVEIAYITLHVGTTEILAVRHISEEEIEDHKVKPEYFEVGDEAAAKINRAKAEGRRIFAVGTTVMRTLESLLVNKERKTTVQAKTGWTNLYIYPGFEFKVVDVLLTNLHQPRSSHIVLTAAFASKDFVMRSYDEMIEKGGYEFDMFGDSMLII
ncbi:hypothetical protein BGZ65_012481 [Modicella reniformis]|uniref:S-adenosylmethionine:tRNA ribosyltransferase-isomerase n=1 Tax=Modicella reniformis TaxID=1440133 RepID=A0A9P6M1L4_9FUNG|nr:hypothetical protein BGZ65_012481 [Modicella reniformis]